MATPQIPITLICPSGCDSLLGNATTDMLFIYNNSNSDLPPFPYISRMQLIAIDNKNKTRDIIKPYLWQRGQKNMTIKFTPNEWITQTDSIGLKVNWQENYYDETLGGYGTVFLKNIAVGNPQSPSNGTVVIKGSSSAKERFGWLPLAVVALMAL